MTVLDDFPAVPRLAVRLHRRHEIVTTAGMAGVLSVGMASRPATTRFTSSSPTSRTASPTARSPALSRSAPDETALFAERLRGSRPSSRSTRADTISSSAPRPQFTGLVGPGRGTVHRGEHLREFRDLDAVSPARLPQPDLLGVQPQPRRPVDGPEVVLGEHVGEVVRVRASRGGSVGRSASTAAATSTASCLLVPITPVGPRRIQPVTYCPATGVPSASITRPATFGTVPVALVERQARDRLGRIADCPHDEPDVQRLLLPRAAHAAIGVSTFVRRRHR